MAHGREIIKVGVNGYSGKPADKKNRKTAYDYKQEHPEFNNKLGDDPAIRFFCHPLFPFYTPALDSEIINSPSIFLYPCALKVSFCSYCPGVILAEQPCKDRLPIALTPVPPAPKAHLCAWSNIVENTALKTVFHLRVNHAITFKLSQTLIMVTLKNLST
jgi:hypothetical protein